MESNTIAIQADASGAVDVERTVWTPEEDVKIAVLVETHGNKAWSAIAAEMPTRTGKQCRERWHNRLDPIINKGDWTEQEDLDLIEAHRTMGNRWSEIAKVLSGRTDNQVKNRWNSALRRELRKLNRLASKQSSEINAVMLAATAAVQAAAAAIECGAAVGVGSALPLIAAPAAELDALLAGLGGEAAAPTQLETEASVAIAPTADTAAPAMRPLPKGGSRKRQSPAELSTAAMMLVSSEAELKLDTMCSFPFGISAEDQQNASQLLDHMLKLRATWDQPPDGPDGRIDESSLEPLSEHVAWLQSFCTHLVVRSLQRRQEKTDETSEGGPKRRRRRSSKKATVTEPGLCEWGLGPLGPMGEGERSGAASLSHAALNIDDILSLVDGRSAMPSSSRGVPLATLGSHTSLAALASPLTIYESDFGSAGALSSPASLLSLSSPGSLLEMEQMRAEEGAVPHAEWAASDWKRSVRQRVEPSDEQALDGPGARLPPPLDNEAEFGAGVGMRRRPFGATNLQISGGLGLSLDGSKLSAVLGSARSCTSARGPSTARLAALISPSLASPSVFGALLSASSAFRSVCAF